MSGQQSEQPPAVTSDDSAEAHPRPGPRPRPRPGRASAWTAARGFLRELWTGQSVRRYWSLVAAGLLAVGAYAEAAGALWDVGGWMWPFDGEPAATGRMTTTTPSTASTATSAAPAPGATGPGVAAEPGPTAPSAPAAPATVPEVIGLRGTPAAMTSHDGALWVATAGEDLVSRLDAETGAVVRTERLNAPPVGILHDDGSLWVVHADRTVRLDPETLRPRHGERDVVDADEVEGRHVVVAGVPGVGQDDGVWLVTEAGANAHVYALDPGRPGVGVERLVSVVGEPIGLVANRHSVWVGMDDGGVHRVDAQTGRSDPVVEIGAPLGAMARHGGYLWLTSPTEARAYRVPISSGGTGRGQAAPVALTETGSELQVSPSEVVTEPGPIVAVGDNVWVVDRARGTLARINGPSATVVGGFPSLGRQPVALTWTDGVLWTALAGDRAVARTEIPFAD